MTPSFTCPYCGGTYVGYRDRDVAVDAHSARCIRWPKEKTE